MSKASSSNAKRPASSTIYKQVTTQIIASLEAGVRPWMPRWQAGHIAGPITKPLRHSYEGYRGINVLVLWLSALEKGYEAPLWMTYKQAKDLGAQVRKGEKGIPVVYFNTFLKEDETPQGDTEKKSLPFLKTYSVFNVEQIEGLEPEYYEHRRPEVVNTAERLQPVESFIQSSGAKVSHHGNRAYFSSLQDLVVMPPYESFESQEAYYATLCHELIHWTGHKDRLNRDLAPRFQKQAYAAEELVGGTGGRLPLCRFRH